VPEISREQLPNSEETTKRDIVWRWNNNDTSSINNKNENENKKT